MGRFAYNSNVGQATTSGYDETSNNRFFADNINNLPSGIIKGRFYIGLKSNGSSLQGNDQIVIGKFGVVGSYFSERLSLLTSVNGTQSYFQPWSNQLVSTTVPTTDILWQDFSNIKIGPSTSLLDHVQTNSQFDAFVQDDTSVDFITVASCSKKDPVVEITPILENFQCKTSQGLTMKQE